MADGTCMIQNNMKVSEGEASKGNSQKEAEAVKQNNKSGKCYLPESNQYSLREDEPENVDE